MTLLKSMWKSVVLAGIAGVLAFAGGALGADITISTPPANATVTEGSITATDKLSVVASTDASPATGTLSYQWKVAVSSSTTTGASDATGGSAISANFAIPTDLTSAGGPYYYFVVVSGNDGEAPVNSNIVTVTVNAPGSGSTTPTITISTQPSDATVTQGSITATNTLSVVASTDASPATGTLSYQWKVAVSSSTTTGASDATGGSATSANFAIPTDLTSAGGPYYYFVVVSGNDGEAPVNSNIVTVTVNAPGGGTWDKTLCQNIANDAEFGACFNSMQTNLTQTGNPLGSFFDLWTKSQWTVGDGVSTVSKDQAVKVANDKVEEAVLYWLTNESDKITFASPYKPNFVVVDGGAGWVPASPGTAASKNGTAGRYEFLLKLRPAGTTGSSDVAITGSVTNSITVVAVKFFDALTIAVSGPVESNKTVVEGTVTTRDVFTVSASVGGAVPAGSRNGTLEYRWFKPPTNLSSPSAVPTPANSDPAAAGSVWAAASANGNIYQIPAELTVGKHYFYCRVRSTVKKADGITDSMTMAQSAVRMVEVKTRPEITGAVTAALSSAAGTDVATVGGISATIGVSAASIASPGALTYQWYYNGTNSTVGGVEMPGATTASFTVPTNLQTGFYYYFCEVRADNVKAAPRRSGTVKITVNPVTTLAKPVTALEERYVVQVNSGSADYSRTGTLRLSVPLTTSATLVSPAVTNPAGGNLSFDVVRIIYQKGSDVPRVYDKDGKPEDDATLPGLHTFARPSPLDKHCVDEAGTYNVTVVVRSSNESPAGDPNPATQREGSRTVTFTVYPKALANINTKTVLPATVAYDGKTKVPTISLVDGSGSSAYSLVAGTNSLNNDYGREDGDLTNAGTASITFTGRNNYTGTLVLSFTITKKEIRYDSIATKAAQVVTAGNATQPVWLGKTYDGTNVVDVGKLNVLNVKFSGLVNDADISNGNGYTVTALSYDAANAGSARVVNGTVRLDTSTTSGSLGRNYSFVGGSTTSTFAVSGVTIAKRDPVTEDFDFTIPTNIFFTGSPQGIGSVAWQSKYTSTGDIRTVFYSNAQDGLGAVSTLPVGDKSADKDYTVTLNVSGSNNFLDKTGIPLGTFKIQKPKDVTVAVTNLTANNDNKTDPNAYIGDPFTLRTIVTRPDSAKVKKADGVTDTTLVYKGGVLTYTWFIDTASTSRWDTLKVSGAAVKTANFTTTYSAADTVVSNTRKYKVEVTWTYPAVQAPTTATSSTITVTINKERADIAAAVVTVTAPAGGFVYTGETQKPAAVSVKLGTTTLTYNADGSADFVYDVFGEEAGTGVVSVTGTGAYKGKASGTFEIAKKLTTTAGLKYTPASTSVAFNGAAQPITVSPIIGDGLGAVKITYINIKDEDNPVTLTEAPKNAGTYKTLISIAEGKNYTELEEFERPYTITKRFVEKADFNYTMPKGGATPTAVTATLKNPMGYTGTLATLYRTVAGSDLTVVPATEGVYEVRVRVSGDDNFGMVVVTLDTLKIDSNGKVGVKASEREVPKSGETNVVTVAPVKVVASGFTAGPSPVKTGSAIKFFSAKAVKSGSLYIFDANGNSVAKVSAKSASGEIGSWNLKDKKGVTVAEGTYVVKGALVAKDGTKEKVSFVFSVVK